MDGLIDLILFDWRRYLALHKKMNPALFLIVFFNNPGMLFSLFYRIESFLFTNKYTVLKVVGLILYPFYFLFTYYVLDIDISPKVKIGKGLYIHNKGVVLADGVTTGKGLTLIGPLTLGVKGMELNYKAPVLGDNVTVFAGARIIGPVHIKNNVYVGANAVVVKNVSSNCVVGGVPAKILKRIKKHE